MVEKSTFSTSTRMRGRNQMRWKAEWFSRSVWEVSFRRGNEQRETYNLVIRGAGIVPPGRLLHDPARDGLEVEEVVALLEEGHLLDALQPFYFVGRLLGLFLGHGRHVDAPEVLGLGQVLVEGVWGVDGLELFGRIFALVSVSYASRCLVLWEKGDVADSIFDNDLGSSRVFCACQSRVPLECRFAMRTWQEFGDVVCSPLLSVVSRCYSMRPGMRSGPAKRTCTMTQQSSALLCLATSAPVNSPILTC